MKIQVLSSEVVDQIAAGEVVERPAHLVKELIENSLDAGAKNIELDFAQGGRFVRVVDDGCGISPDDLPRAFLRFATSKISLASDLWNLHSFGFRGEALASIAAVSRMTIISREQGGGQAYRVQCQFGQVGAPEPISRTPGTTLIIEDLFSNTPARLKFLKSEAAESTQIKMVFKALALAHPRVSFRISQEGKLLQFWPGVNEQIQRVEQVLEVKPLYVGEAERGGVSCTAYFADPNTTSKTSKNIWLFAQSRWIQDRGLQAAVIEAYRNVLMHGEYPMAACFVKVLPDQIDVNIHPTKSQVKFQDPSLAFRAVQASIRDTIEKAPWVKDILATAPSGLSQYSGGSGLAGEAENQVGLRTSSPAENLSFSAAEFESAKYAKKTMPHSYDVLKTYAPPKVSEQNLGYFSPALDDRPRWADLDILGQAGLTYIVGQDQRGMIFVDQHAAHERVAYERLMAAWKGGKIEVQEFLFPLAVDMSEEKIEAIQSKAQDLEKLGLSIEVLGPTSLGVRAGPLLLKDSAIASELERLAYEIVEHGDSFSLEKAIGDICARLACHSVVRAGQALSIEEMKALLSQMDEFSLSTFCPHGRPVYVQYPFAEVERDFGRLV